LFEHVHKWYPGCPIELHLRDRYPEKFGAVPLQPQLFPAEEQRATQMSLGQELDKR
jgi:hypothetical protein